MIVVDVFCYFKIVALLALTIMHLSTSLPISNEAIFEFDIPSSGFLCRLKEK